jgi:hypothetical protein
MKKLIWAVLLLFTVSISAQSIKVRGFIKDSIGGPLELANVIATEKASGDIEAYAITNYEGRFQLSLPLNKTYVLRASFLGFEHVEKELIIPENAEDIHYTFTLNTAENVLDGVEIIYEMPVTVSGDTITYNADSFKTGEERKLGDVLKNLPGIEVNDDGEIEVEGKAVTKVMIDGKDFFDGDSKLATKNIPADAVDKVQVLRNYNEVDQMQGLGNDRDNVAINIKLKEGKKNFWFGEVTAGGGAIGDDEIGYLAHPKLFYYSPKYSLNFITDFNNIGEVPFTFRDYFNFTGGFRNFNRGGGTRFDVSESDLGFAVAQNNRANEIETKFFAGNFSWVATDKLDLSGFAILSDNTTNIINNAIKQYVTLGQTETANSSNDQNSKLGMLKLSAVYKPNANFQLDYDVLGKTSKQTENAVTISTVDNQANNISEGKENNPFSINQNANAYFTLNEKNIFAAQVQHLWQDEDPFYNAVQDSIPFPGIFVDPVADLPFDPLQEANRYNINQEKNVETNKVDAKIDYYYVLNNTSNLNVTLGTTYSNQKFNSGIFQILDNGDTNTFGSSDFNNDVTYSFTDAFLGLHYKVKTGKFIFTPGISLHNYNLKNQQLGESVTQNDWIALPDVNISFDIKKSETLNFNYAISSEYTDINNYAQAYVFSSYNKLFRGNRNLENAMSHSYNLSYFSFNMFNYTNVSASLNYSKTIAGFKSVIDPLGFGQVSSPINIDSNFPDETFTAFTRFSKRVKKLQFTANANVSISNSFNQFRNDSRESKSLTQSYRGGVRTNFRDWPNFEVGYRISINDFDNGGIEQVSYTHQPSISFDARFWKYFTFNAAWDFFDYSNKARTIENNYSFLNANLYYQKGDSPWEFQLQANNILDNRSTNSDSFDQQTNITSTSQYFVLPRIMMFVVTYDL